jgi:hypothetical protein
MTKPNFCDNSGMISECSADNPEKCKFFERATFHSRCLYQTLELDCNCYNCGCVDAQIDKKQRIEEEESERLEEYTQADIYV